LIFPQKCGIISGRKSFRKRSIGGSIVYALKKLSPLLAVGLTALLMGVAVQHAASEGASLEDRLVVWLLCVVLMGTAAQAIGGLVQRWTGLSEVIGWLALGIGLTNLPGAKTITRLVQRAGALYTP
jgi:hypothetical protein